MGAEPSQPAPGEEFIGSTLRETYRILEVLDQGGMGMVFVAEHTRLKRRVAVKLLAQHLTGDDNALARFHREAEIISQLAHPNIVQVVDFDTTDAGEPYLVMELLKGQSLDSRLELERKLPMVEAVRVAMQAAAGLAAAHEADIVHRDLKPGNVFLVELQGGGSIVKLLDFGISKRTGGSRKLTGEFDILGTPDYMAPEQASGKTALVDQRGDQFSLAVIAYQMLTGALPFAGNDVMEILRRVMLDTQAAPSVLNEDLPKAVDDVFARALAKDPDDRYPSIMDFARALARATGCSMSTGFSVNPGERISVEMTGPISPNPSVPDPKSQATVAQKAAGHMPVRNTPPGDRPSTGTRRKGRPEAVSSITAERVGELLDQAREALGAGAVDSAVDFAEEAIGLANTSDDYLAQRSVRGSETLLTRIYETRLGALTRPVVINGTPRTFSDLSPESAFLLSRLDGGVTFEEALDLSAMPRQEALRHLVNLLRTGVISAG